MKRNTASLLFNRGAGLAVFLFFFYTGLGQQRNLPPVFDSLLRVADELKYQNYSYSDSLYNEAEKLILHDGIQNHALSWISLLQRRGAMRLYHTKFELLQKSITESFRAVEKYKDQIPLQADSLNHETKFIQALYFKELGMYDDALENLEQYEKYLRTKSITASHCFKLFQIAQYQASIYRLKGESESAINQYKASIQNYDCYRDKNTCPNYVLIFNNIAMAFFETGDYENAFHYFSKAKANVDQCLRLLNNFRIRNHALVFYHSYAQYFIQTGNLDSANVYLQRATPLLKENPSFTFRIYFTMARMYQQEGKPEQSLKLYFKTLDDLHNMYGEKHPLISRTHNSISRLYEQTGDFNKALVYTQKALNSEQREKLNVDDYSANPSLHAIYSKKDMILTLHQKASLLSKLYMQKRTESLLLKARETNLLAIQLLDSTRNSFTLDKDKVVLGEEAFPVYETGIEIAYELYKKTKDQKYSHEIFWLIDKSKSAVLHDHIKAIKKFSGMSDELSEKERQLKLQLSVAEEKLFMAEMKNDESSEIRSELENVKKAYVELNTEIKKYYPRYFNLKIKNEFATLSLVRQKLIKSNQALIEYFLGSSSLYIACITANDVLIFVSKIESLEKQIKEFITLLTDVGASVGNNYPSLLKMKSDSLYGKLLKPCLDKLDAGVSSLIIIPQGILAYLPFEALSSNDRMLVDRFSLSYAVSASLLLEQTQKTSSGRSFAGFNADYSHSGLPELVESFSEVKAVQKVVGGRSELFVNASKNDFKQQANQFKVLHLALHSFINDEKPLFSRLVFSNSTDNTANDITANELYAMDLNAEMVVLSACETGLGQLHRGEGMMSLSRAFMYAGVPSTIISLWKVPDNSTSLLMVKFYSFLKQGLPKDVALAKAKKEFINEYPEMSHPFFWAGFVINGKTDPIEFEERGLMVRVGIVTISLLMLIMFIRFWRKKKILMG